MGASSDAVLILMELVVVTRWRWASSTVVVKLPARLEAAEAEAEAIEGCGGGGCGDRPGEGDDPRRRAMGEAISWCGLLLFKPLKRRPRCLNCKDIRIKKRGETGGSKVRRRGL